MAVMCWSPGERKDTVRSLTEEFLLLAFDEQTGKSLLDSTKLHVGVAAAALVDLTMSGALEVATEDGEVKRGRLRRTGVATPSGAIMIEILDRAHGQKPRNAVSDISGVSSFKNRAAVLKDEVLAGLAAEGVLTQESTKVLGIFPSVTWKERDGRIEHEIRGRVQTAVTSTLPPDPRTAALVSLLSATDLAHRVIAGDKREIRRRAKEISKDEWAGPAVKAAVDEIAAVVTVVVTGAATGSA